MASKRLIALALLVTVFLVEARAEEAGEWTYVVDDNAPTLYEIGIVAYGNRKLWSEIAEWNGLARPYHVWIGQKLIMRKPRRYGRKRGLSILLAYWRGQISLRNHEEKAVEIKKVVEQKKVEAVVKRQEFIQEVAAIKAADPEAVELEVPTVEKLMERGEKLLEEKKFDDALEQFRLGRDADPGHLPAWFVPIRTLKTLGRADEEAKLSEEFLERYPQYKMLPMFRKKP